EARRAGAERRQAEAAGELLSREPSRPARVEPARPVRPAAAPREAGPAKRAPEPAGDRDVSDTGKLRAEVAAFLNRDSAEEIDDSEVQEFLKERGGFDPSELG
ncbi:MAG TPA: hypothetical protein VFP98_02980, partial [Candidatus Polarisedimenticolia bacterium]|nr:hypothetical protein [Candidatus Polarisedimenticolia bacterium]